MYAWGAVGEGKVIEKDETFKNYMCYFRTMFALAIVKVLFMLFCIFVVEWWMLGAVFLLMIIFVIFELVVQCVGCSYRNSVAGKLLAEEGAPKSGKFMRVNVIL